MARFDTTQLDERLREYRAELETTLQEKREKEQRNLEVSLRQLRLDLVKAEGELKKVDLDLSGARRRWFPMIELKQTRLSQAAIWPGDASMFLREKIEFERSHLVQSKLELLDVKKRVLRGQDRLQRADAKRANSRFARRSRAWWSTSQERNGDRWEVGEGVWMLAKILKVADVSTLQVEADMLEVDASRLEPGPARRRSPSTPCRD